MVIRRSPSLPLPSQFQEARAADYPAPNRRLQTRSLPLELEEPAVEPLRFIRGHPVYGPMEFLEAARQRRQELRLRGLKRKFDDI